MQQFALVILKPDAVERGLVGRIITRLENKGITIGMMSYSYLKEEDVRKMYKHIKDLKHFEDIISFMTSGECVLIHAYGEETIPVIRRMIGSTFDALPGTIRGDFGIKNNNGANLVHCSDSEESEVEEMAIMLKYFLDGKQKVFDTSKESYTRLITLPVGTEFFVVNGGWEGRISEKGGVKTLVICASNLECPIGEDYELIINIHGEVSDDSEWDDSNEFMLEVCPKCDEEYNSLELTISQRGMRVCGDCFKQEVLTEYWRDNYATSYCTLCGNTGILDTSKATNDRGEVVGRVNFCLCPNGRLLRKKEK